MANKKITELPALTTPDNADLFIIDDVSAVETKKITFQNVASTISLPLSQSLSASLASESLARNAAIADASATLTIDLTGLFNTGISASNAAIASESLARQNLSSSLNLTIANVSSSLGDSISNVSSSLNVTIANVSSSLGNSISNVSSSLNLTIANVSSSLGDRISNVSSSINLTIINVSSSLGNSISNVSSSVTTYVDNSISTAAGNTAIAIANLSASIYLFIGDLSGSITQSFQLQASASQNSLENAIIPLATTSSNTFIGNQFVTGSVTATAGFSGSLTRLANGLPYMVAGPNITVATNSLGQIEITGSAGGSGSPGGSFGQIQFNNSGTFGGVTNLTWNGSTLFATGSFKGNLDGNAATATSASFATNALTASFALTASLAQTAVTATSLTTTGFFISLDGIADGVATNIGSVYIPSTVTITTNSLAYIGGSTASETAVLKLVPINSVSAAATWTRTNILGSVALASSAVLAAGWYDVILEAGSGVETSFARGLYITT